MNRKGFSTIFIIIITIIITIIATALVIGGGVYFWQRLTLEKIKEELRQEIAQPEIPTPTPTSTPTDEYEGWLTYVNDIYGYQFRYPKEAKIEEAKEEAFSLTPEEYEAGMTFADKYRKYTGKICVNLSYKLGYVRISAPPNKESAHVICGRTSRAYEGPEKSEELIIDGRSYTARGFEERGPGETLDFHNETLWVILDDGTRIEYGSRPDESFTFADYLKIRDEIIKIVESYRRT